MTTQAQAVVVMLTDSQLAEEIAFTRREVCCPDWPTAASLLCGCGGNAAGYLARLTAEQRSREGDQS